MSKTCASINQAQQIVQLKSPSNYKMNLTKVSEETAVLSIKMLLKSHPHGLEFKEVNRLFVRRFGVPLDPLSYDCLNLPDFFLRIAAKDKSFLIINENRIKLEHVEISNALPPLRLPRPRENLDEGDEGHLRRQPPVEEAPMVCAPPHPKSKVAISAFDTSFSGGVSVLTCHFRGIFLGS